MYLNFVTNIKNVVSGSTTTGVIDATLYLPNCVSIDDFSEDVKLFPVVVLTEIKTLPYSGVLTTPKLESNDPFSPPHTCTDSVFAYNFLT